MRCKWFRIKHARIHSLTNLLSGFTGTFDEFLEVFLSGLQNVGDWWSHVLSGFEKRNHPNVQFLWYEDMKMDLTKIIEKLCKFLDCQLSREQIEVLVEHVNFDNMKKNPNINPTGKTGFFRKGIVGDWKNTFSKGRMKVETESDSFCRYRQPDQVMFKYFNHFVQ